MKFKNTALWALLLFVPSFLFSQDCVFLAVESKEVSTGNQTCVDVAISNANDLANFQWTINWDTTILSYSNISNIAINDMLINDTSFAAEGRIPMVWVTAGNFLNYTSPTSLLTICFDAIGTVGSTSDVNISNIELGSFVNNDIVSLESCINNGSITLSDTPTNDPILTLISEQINPNCFQGEEGSIYVEVFFGTAPLNFSWTGDPIGNLQTNQILGLANGPYAVVVVDDDGNIADASFNVIEELQDLTNALITPDCVPFGQIELAIQTNAPPLTYTWSNGAIGDRLVGLEEGTYTVTVTDNNNCTAVGSFDVNGSISHIDTFTTVPPLCEQDQGAIININPSDLHQPYTYVWSDGTNSPYKNGLSVGQYTVTIVDAKDCIATYDFDLVVNDTIANASKSTFCTKPGEATGQARIVVSPQSSGYTINWTDGVTLPGASFRDSLPRGTHVFSVTNESGCDVLTDSVTIEEGLVDFKDTYYNCSQDSMTLFVTPGLDSLSYIWYQERDFVSNKEATVTYLRPVIDPPSDSIPNPTRPEFYSPRVHIKGSQGCAASYTVKVFNEDFCVWPGDTNDDRKVDALDILNIALANGSTGAARDPQSIEWFAQASSEWGMDVPNTMLDQMFADCNGDGTVDFADTTAVVQNYSLSHLSFYDPSVTIRNSGLPLRIDLPENIKSGESYAFDIVLGEEGQNTTEEVYGLAFQISYNPTIVDASKTNIKENGWLSNEDEVWALDFNQAEEGLIEGVITRTDGQAIIGGGVIGTIQFDFDSVMTDQPFDLSIAEPYLINSTGEVLEVTGENSNSMVSATTSTKDTEQQLWKDEIFPNPVREQLFIRSTRSVDSFVIFNALGQLVQQGTLENNFILTRQLHSGVYYLQLRGKDGVSTHSFFRSHFR